MIKNKGIFVSQLLNELLVLDVLLWQTDKSTLYPGLPQTAIAVIRAETVVSYLFVC